MNLGNPQIHQIRKSITNNMLTFYFDSQEVHIRSTDKGQLYCREILVFDPTLKNLYYKGSDILPIYFHFAAYIFHINFVYQN